MWHETVWLVLIFNAESTNKNLKKMFRVYLHNLVVVIKIVLFSWTMNHLITDIRRKHKLRLYSVLGFGHGLNVKLRYNNPNRILLTFIVLSFVTIEAIMTIDLMMHMYMLYVCWVYRKEKKSCMKCTFTKHIKSRV